MATAQIPMYNFMKEIKVISYYYEKCLYNGIIWAITADPEV